ncbi:MAG: beta-agarase [Nitrospirae bacterium]|nr:beta-agarase [Nitrospirota bacterium]
MRCRAPAGVESRSGPVAALLLAIGIGSVACSSAATDPCDPSYRGEATGFFRVELRCDRWWLVGPDGGRFYSTGVNHASYNGDRGRESDQNPYHEAVAKKYGGEEAWADETSRRLLKWGWTTVGAWSSNESLGKRMPYTIILNLAQADWQTGRIPDYFSTEWEAGVARLAGEGIAGRESDPLLVGYFIDNELHWGPDWRVGREIFDDYLKLDASVAGKKAVLETLKERHRDNIARFNEAWGTSFGSFEELAATGELPSEGLSPEARADRADFLRRLSDRFFAVTAGTIRGLDPNHLVLGARFVSAMTPREVAAASAAHLDVVSVNAYEFVIDPALAFPADQLGLVRTDTSQWLEHFHALTGRPILVTEFGFRAADSGLPNTWPPIYPTLENQIERADRFEAYARRCFAAPYVVGYHWFEYADQPAEGRFDGENNNWGLVNVADEPYDVLVERTAKVNRLPEEF